MQLSKTSCTYLTVVTPQTLRLTSLLVFLATGFIAAGTFKNIAGMSSTKPVVLWIAYYIFTAVCIVLYIVSQLVLVIRTLEDRWPIGAIIFGVGFFAAGQALIYGFSVQICNAIKHYLDGLFFGSLCTLLSVMMVYKYYDMITKEDLEFSVGSKQAVWEVKEPLLGSGAPSAFQGFDSDTASMGGMPPYSHPSAAGAGAYYARDQPAYYAQPGYGQQYQQQQYPPTKY